MMAGRGSDPKAMPPDPLSVEQIVTSAQSYDYNPHIPLKYWLRTASTLLKEVWPASKCADPATANDRYKGRDLRARRERAANLSTTL